MKKILFILGVLMICSCAPRNMDEVQNETVYTNIHITSVEQYKYSRIEGYIFYNGIKLPILNGSTGYYYKKYIIKPGDIVKKNVTVYIEYEYNRTIITTGEVDFSEFIIN
jgi:hypothetical protein